MFQRETSSAPKSGKARNWANWQKATWILASSFRTEVVADMVAAKLLSAECADGFLLDGFPRTIRQAELLEKALDQAGKKLDAVVLFDAPEELLIQRLTARLTCRKCGASFNKIFAKPKVEGVCDHCGGELYQRSDDSLETLYVYLFSR